MDERPDSSQQLMDILLVMDEKGTLQAVSGVKDGELQTKNPWRTTTTSCGWIATAICFQISFPTSGAS